MRRHHVVVCEGKTEQCFLDELRVRFRLSDVAIKIVGKVGDPSAILRMAKEEKAAAKSSNIETLVHVVFDRDEHKHWASALAQARESDLLVGASNPCFELWLIFLKADQNAHLERQHAQRQCKKLHPGYCHATNPKIDVSQLTMEEIEQACARSRKRRARLEVEGEDPWMNPVTTFDLTVQAILEDVQEG